MSWQADQNRRAAEPHRHTEPRVLLSDVDADAGRQGSERQMHPVRRVIRRGTVVHALPGSAYETLLGGSQNLGELTGSHRGGVST